MSDEARSAVASFLSVHKGQEKGVTRLSTSAASSDHPFVSAAYACLEEVWTQVSQPHARSAPSRRICGDVILQGLPTCGLVNSLSLP